MKIEGNNASEVDHIAATKPQGLAAKAASPGDTSQGLASPQTSPETETAASQGLVGSGGYGGKAVSSQLS